MENKTLLINLYGKNYEVIEEHDEYFRCRRLRKDLNPDKRAINSIFRIDKNAAYEVVGYIDN